MNAKAQQELVYGERYAFMRTDVREKVLVVINLSGEIQEGVIDTYADYGIARLKLLSGTPDVKLPNDGKYLYLPPYAVQVWRF